MGPLNMDLHIASAYGLELAAVQNRNNPLINFRLKAKRYFNAGGETAEGLPEHIKSLS